MWWRVRMAKGTTSGRSIKDNADGIQQSKDGCREQHSSWIAASKTSGRDESRARSFLCYSQSNVSNDNVLNLILWGWLAFIRTSHLAPRTSHLAPRIIINERFSTYFVRDLLQACGITSLLSLTYDDWLFIKTNYIIILNWYVYLLRLILNN